MSSGKHKNRIKQNIESSNRVYYYNREAKQLLEERPKEALQYAKKARQIARSLLLGQEEVKALSNIAWAYYYLNDNNKAATHALKLLALLNVHDHKEAYSSILTLLGHIYRKTGNFDLSLEHYFEALKLYEDLENNYDIALTYRFMAIVYSHIKNFKQALEYGFKALNIFEGLKIEKRIATVLLTISDIYRELNDKDNCILFSNDALEIYKKHHNKIGVSYCYINLADIYYKNNSPEKTKEYYNQAFQICSELNDKFGIVHIMYYLAKLYVDEREYEDAETHLKLGLKLAKEINSIYIRADFYKLYSTYYSHKNNHRKSLRYYMLYASVKERMISEKHKQLIKHIQTEYDLYKKEKEVELYKLRSEQLIKTNQDLDKAYQTIKSQNEKLKEMSRKLEILSNVDELTKLYNRRWLREKIDQLISTESNHQLYCVVLCDIDNFKLVNDAYGHHFGDTVLIEISGILMESLTSSDYVVRWGGEELLILIASPMSESILTTNKLRKAIENNELYYKDEKVRVTMTFGVCQYKDHDFEKSVIEADKAMYYGKESGKNCVAFKTNNNQKYSVIRD